MSPDAARRDALQRFGRVERIQELCREVRGTGFSDALRLDVRHGLRRLGREPGFTLAAVVTLALGIGATTSIFSVINVIVRPPIGVQAPERLVSIYTSDFSGPRFSASSYPDIQDFSGQTDVFQGVMAYRPATVTLADERGSQLLMAEWVTGNYFDVLGTQPEVGRTFRADETQIGQAERVVVLGHGLWTRQFGQDPDIVRQTIRLDGQVFSVIGVAPKSTSSRLLPGVTIDVWVPLGIPPLDPPGRARLRG